MSSISTSVADAVTVLAQLEDPTPQAPPLEDKIMQFRDYATWLAVLSGSVSIIFAGGRLAWEKMSGGALQSPKMIAAAMAGGVIATSAGTIMETVMGM